MCGFFAKFYFDRFNKKDVETSLKCLSKLTHRGPDDQGSYFDENVFLGSRRLAIIDLSPKGKMPMSNEDGSIWIVFNGEIYNFLKLRKELQKRHKFKSNTDTEVVIHLYEEKGERCLDFLRGMFAFVIWDKRKKILFLARDRLGQKPLKYFSNRKFFIASSELKAILKDPEVPKEIDCSAIDEYLTYQYVPHPKTGFKNIFKLEPAHYLIVKTNGEIIKKRYWSLDFSKKLNLKEEELEELVLEKLKESVRLRLISDVPLGAHLSGGVDSSLIVSLMAQEMKEPVKTFSIGFQEAEYNELPFARLVAQRYQTDHHEFIVKPETIEVLPKLAYFYEEPYADSSALPTWYLSEITKKYITVALNGDGGDENFAGYNRYQVMKFFSFLTKIPGKKIFKKALSFFYQLTKIKIFLKAYKLFNLSQTEFNAFYLNIISYFSFQDKLKIYSKEFLEEIKDSRANYFLTEKFNQVKNLNWLDQLLFVDINSYLPDDLLVKVDIASMAHSLEIRSPFLDHEFMELTARIKPVFKLKGADKKFLLKKIASKFLPQECLKRPKQGFGVPLEKWFRKELKDFVKAQLLDQRFLNYGWFQGSALEKLIKEHQEGENNFGYQLWALLMLREWLRVWFEN